MATEHEGPSEEMRTRVSLRQLEGFRFEVTTDTEQGSWVSIMDEPPPLSAGAGPNAARMLAFAVGHCLSASLLFCLQKSRVPIASGAETSVEAVIRRNERGRWRIAQLTVDLRLPPLAEQSALERCRSIFEDYCIVTASVRQGIPVEVHLHTGASDGTHTAHRI